MSSRSISKSLSLRQRRHGGAVKGGGDGKKRKNSEQLLYKEFTLLNPHDWFLTTKTILPESFKEMTFDERKIVKKYRDKESHVLKAVCSNMIAYALTLAEPSVINGTQLGPLLMLTIGQDFPIIATVNSPVANGLLVVTMPTVQFGHAAHQVMDVA
jgi:hypothetical protein